MGRVEQVVSLAPTSPGTADLNSSHSPLRPLPPATIVSYVAVCQAGLPARQAAPWVGLSPRAVLDAVARGRTEDIAQRIVLDDFLPLHTALRPPQP